MAKKRVKKKKLRIFRLLILLFILAVISFSIYSILNTKIRNITITGTKYLNDEEVLRKAKLTDYPSFVFTIDYNIKKCLLKLPLVKNVNIKRGFFNTITINIDEYKVLLKKNDKYVLENKEEVELDNIARVPRLINDVPDKKYKKLIEALNEVNISVLEQISEIEYVPNTYDKDRFLLYMDDGNSVYLTLTKFEKINYYDKVLTQLEGRKGFLYLDSGNHFKIME